LEKHILFKSPFHEDEKEKEELKTRPEREVRRRGSVLIGQSPKRDCRDPVKKRRDRRKNFQICSAVSEVCGSKGAWTAK